MSKVIKIDHSNVKKLEGARNFSLWKLTLENIFWASGIQEIVFGKETRPSSDPDKEKAWDMNNRAGMAIILQTVDEKLTSYIFSSTTAAAMWTTLDQTFGKSNKWTKQELLQEFDKANLGEKTPTELINNLQSISGQLNAMGYKSLDADAILSKVLHELSGPRFDSLVASWDVVPDAEKTVENLVQKLKIHESREEMWDKEGQSERAFSGKKKVNPVNGGGKKQGTCHVCGKRGHYKADCWSLLKKNEKESGEEKQPVKSQAGKSFMVKSGTQTSRDNFVWFCDSGTNVHVTGRSDWFTSYEKFDVPRKLQIATNKFAECPGVGVVTLQALILKKWEIIQIKMCFIYLEVVIYSQKIVC